MTGTPTHTLLLVEDEELVRMLLFDVLEELGYRVLEARDAASALPFLGNAAQAIDLIVSDINLPDMSGRDLANRARELRPGCKILFLTGYSPDSVAAQLEPGMAVLQKPIAQEKLAARIRAMLEERAP